MEEQITSQPGGQPEDSKNVSAIVISVVVTALIVSGGVYFWQQQNQGISEEESLKQIRLLNDQIDELQKEISTSEKSEQAKTETKASSSPSSDIKFPVVVYGRPGLLNNAPEGLAEKKKLEEKFVNPYIDYYNEKKINLVALYITVPQNIGEEYDVVGIFGSEDLYGTQQFGFGAREGEYGYWNPECMGPCEFSESFKAKYPEIAN